MSLFGRSLLVVACVLSTTLSVHAQERRTSPERWDEDTSSLRFEEPPKFWIQTPKAQVKPVSKPAGSPSASRLTSAPRLVQGVAPTQTTSGRVVGNISRPRPTEPNNCARINPTFTISGGTSPVQPGQPSIYTLTLKNNDEQKCGPTTFSINAIQPNMAGWTRLVGNSGSSVQSVSVNPGATLTTTASVTAASGASQGSYQVYVRAQSPYSAHTSNVQSMITIGAAPPVCTRAAPTLTSSGGSSAVPAGTQVAYTISVRNNDSSACSATVFSTAATPPNGWTAARTPASLSIAPGATQNFTVNVTSPSNATAGTYNTASAVASSESIHARQVFSSYVVQEPAPVCTRAAPSLSIDPDTAPVQPGTQKTYTVRLTNRDSAACAPAAFTLARTAPSGWTSALSPSSVTLNPSASITAQLTATAPSNTSAGTYNLGVGSASSASSLHTVNAAASFVVSAPACVRSAPLLSVSGPSAAQNAGTTARYTVSLTNRDSASCASTSFALSRSVPSNWTGVFSASSLSLAPNASQSVTLDVTSPSNASAGSYTIGLGAGSSESQHSASASATYQVAQGCVPAAPTVTLTPSTTSSVAPGSTITYAASVRNNDSASCAPVSFNLARSVPSGWQSNITPTTVALAPGQTGSSTITVISPTSAAQGSYPVTLGVASSQSIHTASATSAYGVTTAPVWGTSMYKVDTSFVNKSSPQYTAFKSYVDSVVAGARPYGFSAYDAAYMYLLDPQASYCNVAVSFVEADVSAAETRIAAGQAPAIAGDSYLEVGDHIADLAMTLHACPTFVTASQRARWGAYAEQAVWNVWNHQNAQWGGRPFPWSGWSVNNPGNNYQYSFLEATMSWGLISGSQQWITFLQTQKLPPLKAYFATLPGGGSLEGTGYGTAHMRLFAVYQLWKDSTGEDLASFSTHATDSIPYWVHATTPSLDRFAPLGDQARSSEPILYDYHRRLVLHARNLSLSEPDRAMAAWWLNNISIRSMSSSFNRRFDLLPAGPSTTPAPQALQYYAPGVGHIFARSSWSPDAMWVAFIAGTYNESHAKQEQGGFTLFSAGTWQAVTENNWSHSGIQQGSDTNNVLRFERSGAIIPQRESAPEATLTYTPSSGSAFTATANLTPVYGGNTAVGNWNRTINFANRTLRVTDNFTLGSGTTATFQVNTPTQPVVSGNVVTAGNIQIRVLTPSNPTITLKDWTQQDSFEFKRGWRVDINGGTSQYVVEITDRP